MTVPRPSVASLSASELVEEQPIATNTERPSGERVAVVVIDAPCAWISSNDRLHRMAEGKLTKQWREAGAKAAGTTTPFTGQVHITAHIWKDRSGRYDVLNLWPSLKAVIDGIVDAGVLADDDWKHVIGPDMRHGGKGAPRIVLTIEQPLFLTTNLLVEFGCEKDQT